VRLESEVAKKDCELLNMANEFQGQNDRIETLSNELRKRSQSQSMILATSTEPSVPEKNQL
jgi:hypothetical protein